MAASIHPYRAAHQSRAPYSYASSLSPMSSSSTLRYIQPGYTAPAKERIESVRAWQLQQFAIAHRQSFNTAAFENVVPIHEVDWLSKSKRSLLVAMQLNQRLSSQQARRRKEKIGTRETRARESKLVRREKNLKEEQERAEEDGRRRGVLCKSQARKESKREPHETLKDSMRVRGLAPGRRNWENPRHRAQEDAHVSSTGPESHSRTDNFPTCDPEGEIPNDTAQQNTILTSQLSSMLEDHSSQRSRNSSTYPTLAILQPSKTSKHPAFGEVLDHDDYFPPNRGSQDDVLLGELAENRIDNAQERLAEDIRTAALIRDRLPLSTQDESERFLMSGALPNDGEDPGQRPEEEPGRENPPTLIPSASKETKIRSAMKGARVAAAREPRARNGPDLVVETSEFHRKFKEHSGFVVAFEDAPVSEPLSHSAAPAAGGIMWKETSPGETITLGSNTLTTASPTTTSFSHLGIRDRIHITQQASSILRRPIPSEEELSHNENLDYDILYTRHPVLTLLQSPLKFEPYQEALVEGTSESPGPENLMRLILQHDLDENAAQQDRIQAMRNRVDEIVKCTCIPEIFEESAEALRLLEGEAVKVQELFEGYCGVVVECLNVGASGEEEMEGLLNSFFEIRGEWLRVRDRADVTIEEGWHAVKSEWEDKDEEIQGPRQAEVLDSEMVLEMPIIPDVDSDEEM